jgi:hypothetical protein
MTAELPAVPWLVDGALDMAKIPLEYNYKTALGPDREEALNSLRVIAAATSHGRPEASVFLMGFLVNLPLDNWEMRIETVEALRDSETERCAALLFSELRRVKSSNTTRRYINTIIKVLARFPARLTRGEFDALADDRSFSPKLRQKFRLAAGRIIDRDSDW